MQNTSLTTDGPYSLTDGQMALYHKSEATLRTISVCRQLQTSAALPEQQPDLCVLIHAPVSSTEVPETETHDFIWVEGASCKGFKC